MLIAFETNCLKLINPGNLFCDKKLSTIFFIFEYLFAQKKGVIANRETFINRE